MFSPDFNLTQKLIKLSDQATPLKIEQAISCKNPGLEEFAILLSKNIDNKLLKELAKKSFYLTRKRFGYALGLYAPLYYSNKCTNGCLYCGFSAKNKILRKSISEEEILKEASKLREMKFKNILLVAGEHPESSDTNFLKRTIKKLHDFDFSCVSIEIAPLEVEQYKTLVDESHLDGLYVYQETYNKEIYKELHPFGQKSDYDYRLETPERAAKAGVRKIGIGFLLGLNNWREDAINLAQHLLYLQKNYWQVEYSVSFPRITNAAGINSNFHNISNKEFINYTTAMRLLFPETGMSLSTRELPSFRDKIIPLGFTSLSAGSSTAPGGYSKSSDDLEQFEVVDDRSPDQVANAMKKHGFDPVWKDWD